MGDFFLRTQALGTVTPLGPEAYLWTCAHRGRRCANSLQEKKDKLAPRTKVEIASGFVRIPKLF